MRCEPRCALRPSPQDYSASGELESSVLRMPLHCAIQDDALDLVTDRRKLLRRKRMVHALHRLLDDRSFVEVVGDVVRGRADQFDAAGVRLVVGLGTFEAG